MNKDTIIARLEEENRQLKEEINGLRQARNPSIAGWNLPLDEWLLLDQHLRPIAGSLNWFSDGFPAEQAQWTHFPITDRYRILRNYLIACRNKSSYFRLKLNPVIASFPKVFEGVVFILHHVDEKSSVLVVSANFAQWMAGRLTPFLLKSLNPLLHLSGNMVWYINSDGYIEQADGCMSGRSSAKVARLSGLRVSGITGTLKPLADFVINSRNKLVFEPDLVAGDCHYSCFFIPAGLFGGSGEGAGIAVFSDSTERHRTISQSKDTERLYQTLFDLSPAGIILEDAKGNILKVNQAILRSTGYNASELIGRNVTSFASAENKSFVEGNIRRILDGETLNIDVESYRQDGSRFFSQLTETLITLPTGEKAILSISQDITDRVEMEQALLVEKEKYRRIFESVQDVFFQCDYSGEIRVMSPSVARYLGHEPAELEGKNIAGFCINPDDHFRMISVIQRQGEVTDFELALRARNGDTRYFSVNAHFLYDNRGSVTAIEGTLRDVTERRGFMHDLMEARKRAEESVRLKSSLLSNLSHEFRTPLNAILGFSQILQKSHPDPAVIEMASKIIHSGERLLRTLESIMMTAQLDSGAPVNLEVCGLVESLVSVLHTYKQKAEEKGLLFIFEADESPDVMTDEKLLNILVAELLDNAVKFTKEGGVSIRFSSLKSVSGDMARIEIRDSGIGISKEQHQLVFTEFRQGSEGISRNFEGLGLGLAIVKRIVSILGLTMGYESIPGKGTVFYIDIPFHEGEVTQPRPELAAPQKAVENPLALLVEDNEPNREVVESYLEGTCRVDAVPRYYDALKLIGSRHYDLFLLDINLGPGPDGSDLLQEIRKMTEYKNVPVIAVTGYAMLGDGTKLLQSGFTHYIRKPFDKEELTILVRKALGMEP